MPQHDRERWDNRYREGAYKGRPWPSQFLSEVVAQVVDHAHGEASSVPETKRALDIASGAGRNAMHLAEAGYQVDAVDIASAAIARGASQGARRQLSIHWYCQDVLSGPMDWLSRYQMIILFRFVALDLIPQLVEHLAPGGHLVIEEHLQWQGLRVAEREKESGQTIVGPTNPRFRVAPGELLALVEQSDALLRVRHQYDGLNAEPDGTSAAVSRLWVQAPDADL